jgi:UDP-N-acetylglucosamine 4,6-dehydratase
VRYGNVVGSRGSVIPVFLEQRAGGKLTVTDERMTRFWHTLEQGVEFVIDSIGRMKGGEVFIPRIPSMGLMDLARAIAPECGVEVTGIRPGEKLHESLMSADEARHARAFEDFFVVVPEFHWWSHEDWDEGETPPEGFSYTSDGNDRWLTGDELKELSGL